MGAIHGPPPVKLFVGLLTGTAGLVGEVRAALEASLGPVDIQSDVLPFDFTDYYNREMGVPLRRVFFSFERLVDPAELAAVKVRTNALEARFQRPDLAVARPVNLDPGYLELSKLVLASTKNFFHRVYIGQGIYAEVTLVYQKGRFAPLKWTYPDYRSEPYQEYFLRVRDRYRRQLAPRPENL